MKIQHLQSQTSVLIRKRIENLFGFNLVLVFRNYNLLPAIPKFNFLIIGFGIACLCQEKMIKKKTKYYLVSSLGLAWRPH